MFFFSGLSPGQVSGYGMREGEILRCVTVRNIGPMLCPPRLVLGRRSRNSISNLIKLVGIPSCPVLTCPVLFDAAASGSKRQRSREKRKSTKHKALSHTRTRTHTHTLSLSHTHTHSLLLTHLLARIQRSQHSAVFRTLCCCCKQASKKASKQASNCP